MGSKKSALGEMAIVVFWAILVSASLWRNLALIDTQADQTALARARMLFSVIETTRLWNARHGGVYVPVTEETPPNPWLSDPARDVVIDGKPYTKVNPAYMTRQVSELVRLQQGVTFHITSRNPIRPGNAPDSWEFDALTLFERGADREVVGWVDYKGLPAFRYMAALMVKEPCLVCHRSQGYKLGDIRGGISVTIPADGLRSELDPQRRQAILVHAIGFLALAGASVAFGHRLRRSWRQLEAARAEQERIVAERTRELTGANSELARSNAELENFAYVASHDLQEPLRMMGAYAQLIERRYGDRLDAEGAEFLGYMTGGAARMKAMIDDLLAYSRVSRGEPAFTDVELDVALDLALANVSAAVAEAGAEIVRPPEPLPVVRGELPLLARLLQNLVGNAVKYRRADLPARVEIAAEQGDGEWIVSVTDNGIGVPADARERIFMVFQRLHTREAYPGTGIGLAICRRIVERHHGRIWVEDSASGGCRFRFTLPIVPPVI